MAAVVSAAKQIPIVCPGHTRPLAELQYVLIKDNDNNTEETFLLSACHDKVPMLRDALTGNWIGSWIGHKGAVWSCQMDPTGSLAATASGDYSARVWDAITGQSLIELPHKHIVKTVTFSPNSQRLATGGKEGTLRIYELSDILLSKQNSNNNNNNKKADASIAPALLEITQESPITKIIWVTDELLLCSCMNGKIYLWNTNDNEPSLDEGGCTLHPSGKKFVAGGSDLWVRVFDFETGEQLECHKGHHGPIRCVRFSPDGQTYASGSEDGTIRLWKA
ncbi:WD40 repeat-like protein [Fragilariopsis cylindrus CCMP1102]|uniref:Serine-threonine kinase receptor-associated protein n=1 Tax=Fragilariopsis cylindrus CCMP1102 TaxID=635003 RepID=A0A1E7FT52_9STRA|nr:WD40 repeat-like protein [Fragilariopsis cylindrus CCMP1102]|eukprot:OEU21350.1 WD40 repeat-like protein [Fragilariopsis cylindrus CCMP1102]